MRRLVALLALISLLVAGCGSDEPAGLFREDESADAPDYSYTIVAGTGEAVDRGEDLDILPQEMHVRVGEMIELINQDDRGHLVGPFYVGKGETLRQRFSDTGMFIGECTVHPGGQITLYVEE